MADSAPRTRRNRQTETRERILDAASAIVAEHGVGAATTKRIATTAGVAEGSLYNHFADKPHLLTALVMERLPGIRGVFGALYGDAATIPLAERLAAGLEALIGFYSAAQPIVAGISADPHLLDLCRKRFAETGDGPQRAHEKLADFLEAERQAGRMPADADPAMLAALLIGACTEYASLARIRGTPPSGQSAGDYARAIVDTLSPLLIDTSTSIPWRP